jgi:1-acyl-sn-glycerol-3-phosphate acyltransferase
MFGSGSLIFCLVLSPIIFLCAKDKAQLSYWVRTMIRYVFWLYLKVLEFLRILKIKTEGLEPLLHMKGKIVICNHPSLLDIVIIMSRLKNIQCVVNSKLWSNPFIGLILRAAGYIRNDLGPQSFLEQCKQLLSNGENIVIFPEGTRSIPGQQMKLCRGVANLSLSAKTDIQALTLTCMPIWLIKGSKWHEIPSNRAIFFLRAGPAFSYQKYLDHSPRSIQARNYMRDIQHYYNRELKHE